MMGRRADSSFPKSLFLSDVHHTTCMQLFLQSQKAFLEFFINAKQYNQN